VIKLVINISLLLLSFTTGAAWQPLPTTEQGHKLRYNSSTEQIQVLHNSQARLLWDGIHRLETGDVIRIYNGVATQDSSLQNALLAAKASQKTDKSPACNILVRKICGLQDSCSSTQDCANARRLKSFYEKTKGWKYALQCNEALTDDNLLSSCPIPKFSVFNSACDSLVKKSCGIKTQCSLEKSCDLARQLRQMEYKERVMQPDAQRPSYTTNQCHALYADDNLFKPCWQEP